MSIQSIQLIHYFLKEVNKARTDPQPIIQHLKKRQFINHNEFKHSIMNNIRFKTDEGEKAVQQAISELYKYQKSQQLHLSNSLSQCAYQIGLKMSKQHNVEDLSEYHKEIEKQLAHLQVTEYSDISIIIEYGFRKDPEVIPSIIVDDGDTDRIRRKSLLDPNNHHIGIAVHEHQEYDYIVIFLLTSMIQQPLAEEEDAKCKCSIF